MPEILKKLLTWIDAILDPQPAEELDELEVQEIDFREFFTEPLHPPEDNP